MRQGRIRLGRGSGPSRSDNWAQRPPGGHSLELTGKELRS
jgi:hypothetical protein